jgi:MFS family permease
MAGILKLSGAGAAFMVIAAFYLPAFWFTAKTPPLRPGALATLPIREQIREGGRYIWERGVLRLLLVLVVLHCALTMSFDSILPLFAKDNLNGSGSIYSSLVAAVGLGAIAGTLYLAGLRLQGRRGSLLLASGVASGLSTAFMAVSGVWVVALGAMLLVGATLALFVTLYTTMVQEVTPDGLRGRVTGIFLMSAGGIMSFSNLANGYLSDHVGASRVLALPGGAFVALLLGISFAQPTLRRVYRQGRLPREAALAEA